LTSPSRCFAARPRRLSRSIWSEDGRRLCYRGGDGTGKGKARDRRLDKALVAAGIGFGGIDIHESSLEDIFVGLLSEERTGGMSFNWRSAWAIYQRELLALLPHRLPVDPVAGADDVALFRGVRGGDRRTDGRTSAELSYAAFIMPRPADADPAQRNHQQFASFGIYMPRFTGTIYELLSRRSAWPRRWSASSGRRPPRAVILAAIILATAMLFVDYTIAHPLWAVLYIMLVAAAFSLFGFILGIWADNFEKLGIIPMLILTPLTFLGGTFYSIEMLPEPWDTLALANPIVYLVNGLRWTFYGSSDVSFAVSLGITGFLALCTVITR
jgi:ABC-2 type transport system permease protein